MVETVRVWAKELGGLPEVRRLLCRLGWAPSPRKEEALRWSACRRCHQMRAKRCHYRRRGATFGD